MDVQKVGILLRWIGFCWKRDHAPCDEVPNAPDISPIFPTWNAKWAQVIVLLRLPLSVLGGGC